MTLLIILIISDWLLFFAIRAALLHVRANRRPKVKFGLDRKESRSKREENNRIKAEILRKLLASGRLLK